MEFRSSCLFFLIGAIYFTTKLMTSLF